ncbi:MAG: hypothetical protein R3D05_05035 [Dongiaceae bacterium]
MSSIFEWFSSLSADEVGKGIFYQFIIFAIIGIGGWILRKSGLVLRLSSKRLVSWMRRRVAKHVLRNVRYRSAMMAWMHKESVLRNEALFSFIIGLGLGSIAITAADSSVQSTWLARAATEVVKQISDDTVAGLDLDILRSCYSARFENVPDTEIARVSVAERRDLLKACATQVRDMFRTSRWFIIGVGIGFPILMLIAYYEFIRLKFLSHVTRATLRMKTRIERKQRHQPFRRAQG